jgi:predicted branched-subunit amino acid permease
MSTSKEIHKGAMANLPIAPSVIAYGSVFGMLVSQKSIGWVEMLLMNISIFAGSSLFVMVDMWTESLPIFEIIIAVFIINLRYLLICASLYPLFTNATFLQKFILIHFVADENWAVTMSENRKGKASIWFLFGGGVFILLVWCFGTLLGYQLGAVIKNPELYAFDFAFLAVFTAFAASIYRGKHDNLPYFAAALIAIITEQVLPGKWYIIFGGIGGAIFALVNYEEEMVNE